MLTRSESSLHVLSVDAAKGTIAFLPPIALPVAPLSLAPLDDGRLLISFVDGSVHLSDALTASPSEVRLAPLAAPELSEALASFRALPSGEQEKFVANYQFGKLLKQGDEDED